MPIALPCLLCYAQEERMLMKEGERKAGAFPSSAARPSSLGSPQTSSGGRGRKQVSTRSQALAETWREKEPLFVWVDSLLACSLLPAVVVECVCVQ